MPWLRRFLAEYLRLRLISPWRQNGPFHRGRHRVRSFSRSRLRPLRALPLFRLALACPARRNSQARHLKCYQGPSALPPGQQLPLTLVLWGWLLRGCVIAQCGNDGLTLVLWQFHALTGSVPLVDAYALGFQLRAIGIEIGPLGIRDVG